VSSTIPSVARDEEEDPDMHKTFRGLKRKIEHPALRWLSVNPAERQRATSINDA